MTRAFETEPASRTSSEHTMSDLQCRCHFISLKLWAGDLTLIIDSSTPIVIPSSQRICKTIPNLRQHESYFGHRNIKHSVHGYLLLPLDAVGRPRAFQVLILSILSQAKDLCVGCAPAHWPNPARTDYSSAYPSGDGER